MTQNGATGWVGLRLNKDTVKTLTPAQALGLLILAANASCEGVVVATRYDTLAGGTCLKPSTLRHATAALQKDGWISRTRGLNTVGFRLHCAAFGQEATSGSGRSQRDGEATSGSGRSATSPSGRSERPAADVATTRETEKDSDKESPSGGEVTVVGGPPAPVPPAPLAPPDAGLSAEVQGALRGLEEDVFTTPITPEERRAIAVVLREPKLRGLSPTDQAGAVVVAANVIAAGGWHRTPPLWAERIKKAVEAARASPRGGARRPAMTVATERAGITRADLAAQQASAERIMARRRGDALVG